MIEKIFSNSLYKKHRKIIICIIDLITVTVSVALAYWINNNFKIPDFKEFNFSRSFFALLIILFVYLISFIIFKVHSSLWKYVGPIESVRIGASVILATAVLLCGAIGLRLDRAYLGITVTTGLLSVLIMFNVRMVYRLYRNRTSLGEVDRAIIIGAGDAGYILMKELSQNDKYHADVVGFVDDKRQNTIISGHKVLGDTYDLPAIVTKHDIKIAFIAIPSASKEEIRRIYDICQSLKLITKIMKEGNIVLDDKPNTTYNNPIKDISIEDLLGRGEIHLQQDEIRSYLTNKVVAVTGAGGSIGSELCRQIVKFHPKKLIMIDINENSLYMLEQEFNRNRAHHEMDMAIEIISLIVSIRDYDALNSVFNTMQPEVVFHAAAHKHVPLMETRPMEAIKNNVFGTYKVIQACIANKVSRFIIISTDKAVNPTNVMGATKRMTEMLMQAYGKNNITKMAAVRFGNVLGSNGSVIPIFKAQIAEGGPVTITDKNIVRYFMTIPEAAQLVLQAGFYADKGEIFVLDMGQPVKIIDLAEKMIRLSGFKPYVDIDIIEIGLRPGEKMYEELRLDGETAIKTKNDLIFKNNVMNIAINEIQEKLTILEQIIDGTHDNKEIKDILLDLIKDTKEMSE